ncbi:hypothetical protein E1B28_003568 [Marasmius oreades]|uniref:Uncharacterized protein n=1 Tax=Marasmius oreades TaxID=181124 RepID=A0A9P7RMG9_9AGAR|nr:uncharacterized protein E1B28_003568 [Marasmius oreades]KAG7086047.1 hypothetical protein E1B28_003568 [Marasmius oreades]
MLNMNDQVGRCSGKTLHKKKEFGEPLKIIHGRVKEGRVRKRGFEQLYSQIQLPLNLNNTRSPMATTITCQGFFNPQWKYRRDGLMSCPRFRTSLPISTGPDTPHVCSIDLLGPRAISSFPGKNRSACCVVDPGVPRMYKAGVWGPQPDIHSPPTVRETLS